MIAAEKIHALEQIDEVFHQHRKSVATRRKEAISFRKDRLIKLREWIHSNRNAIHHAAYSDFRKPALEVDGIEIFHVLNEIKEAINHLDTWAQPKKVDAPLTMLGTRSWIQYEPRGVCLIISPWNYPFSLAVGPLVSALAAGNNVILKPSEFVPHVSALLKKMVEEVFDPTTVHVCEGAVEISQHLLTLPFDHIFFTGSPAVGKIVMKAAAANLTSVTLELGGKSPTVVTASARLADAAKRIAVAKFVNNGQTCVAPDYILVDEKIAAAFISALIEQIKKLFLQEGESFETSASYCRIVNEKQFERLNEVLQDALYHGAKLEFGGKMNKESNFIHPLVLTHVPLHARIMHEEIFGPILPIVTYKNLSEVVDIITSKPKALGFYIFSQKKSEQQQLLQEISAGGVCINDCAIHFLHHGLPFGGVNNSGMGRSHGHYGFTTFSHEKAVLKQKRGFTSIQLFYPPYTASAKKLMDWFLKLF